MFTHSTTTHNHLQVTLPSTGKPKWKRTFHSEDIKPTKSTIGTTTTTTTTTAITKAANAVRTSSIPSTSESSILSIHENHNVRKNSPLIVEIRKDENDDDGVGVDSSSDSIITTTTTTSSSSFLPQSKKEEYNYYHSSASNKKKKKNNNLSSLSSSYTTTILQHDCCPICTKHQIRYKCPKCNVPFCSAECYQSHNETCTENFYQTKVNDICHLDIQNEQNISQMKDILTRSHYDNYPNGLGGSDATAAGNNSSHKCKIEEENDETKDVEEENEMDSKKKDDMLLTEDELVELATYVLSMKDLKQNQQQRQNSSNNPHKEECNNHDNDDDDELHYMEPTNTMDYDLEHIPQHLRLKFEHAVQRGELSHFIMPWHPYWLPDHHCRSNSIGNEVTSTIVDDDSDEVNNNTSGRETLDERILSIPKLIKPSSKYVELQYNICEVLYYTVYVLRLYNGCCTGTTTTTTTPTTSNNHDGAMDDVYLDSASFLYLNSSCLSNNSKKFENINEVCMECTAKISSSSSNSSCNSNNHSSANTANSSGCSTSIDWKVVLNDISYICQNKRVVLRVLLDALDILTIGYQSLKRIMSNHTHWRTSAKERNTVDYLKTKKEWKLARKKIEYYLSWIIIHWSGDVQDEIVNNVKKWMNDWILKKDDKDEMKDATIIQNMVSATRRSGHCTIGDINTNYYSKKKSRSKAHELMKPISTKLIRSNDESNVGE